MMDQFESADPVADPLRLSPPWRVTLPRARVVVFLPRKGVSALQPESSSASVTGARGSSRAGEKRRKLISSPLIIRVERRPRRKFKSSAPCRNEGKKRKERKEVLATLFRSYYVNISIAIEFEGWRSVLGRTLYGEKRGGLHCCSNPLAHLGVPELRALPLHKLLTDLIGSRWDPQVSNAPHERKLSASRSRSTETS